MMGVRSEEALSNVIGKLVSGVVLTRNTSGNPRSQVFITFSDGTAFEFWANGEVISMASGLDNCSLEEIVTSQERRNDTRVKVFRSRHEDPANPQRSFASSIE